MCSKLSPGANTTSVMSNMVSMWNTSETGSQKVLRKTAGSCSKGREQEQGQHRAVLWPPQLGASCFHRIILILLPLELSEWSLPRDPSRPRGAGAHPHSAGKWPPWPRSQLAEQLPTCRRHPGSWERGLGVSPPGAAGLPPEARRSVLSVLLLLTASGVSPGFSV